MASERRSLALVGAGSLLGREILQLLEGAKRQLGAVRALSERTVGSALEWRGDDLQIERLDEAALEDPTLALAIFCTGRERARRWARRAAERGLPVIDCSAAERHEPSVPLLGELSSPRPASPYLSLPGAPAWMAAKLLQPLVGHGLRRLEATLFVPASGKGSKGVRELSRQTAALLGAKASGAKRFPHRIAFNLFPEVAGFEGEEDRAETAFRAELRRLLGVPGLEVGVTAVRAPLFFGLGATFSATTDRPIDPSSARKLWAATPGVKLLDDPARHVYPMPSLAAGDAAVLVGRVRSDRPGQLQLFAAVDSLQLVAQAAVAAALRLLP